MKEEEISKNPFNKDQQPLIWLPDSGIAVFPDSIVQYYKSRDQKVTSNLTLPTLNDLQQIDKTLSFSKNDITFKIHEEQLKVSIFKIKKQKPELEFRLNKISQLHMVQQILRKKLCELGFEQKFIKIKQIGKGATAKVYQVERKLDGKKFAAKIISLKTTDDKQYDSFINESKILKCLKNRYIVGIQSLYISKKQLICVLEYLEGGTLLDQLKNDTIKTPWEKYKAIKDIAQALEHMRQKRIVHRDLKLQNILVRNNPDKTRDYVITDFGLACWIGQSNLLFQRCGTAGYIAPQILKAGKSKIIVSHASDVFSLGVIYHFIFLLKAVFPFNGNPKQLLISNKKATFSLDTKYHFQLLGSQLNLLFKTLELDVTKRTTSRQLLDIYIKDYQRQINSFKRKIILADSQKRNVSQTSTSRRERLNMGNSIQTIEKRVPSVDRQHFNSKVRTQSSEKKEEKRQSSINKLLNKVWYKIASPRDNRSQSLKIKQQPSNRKKSMKNYIN